MEVITDCDKRFISEFLKNVKLMVKEIREFNIEFTAFLEDQKKDSRELYTLVTRYNILNA